MRADKKSGKILTLRCVQAKPVDSQRNEVVCMLSKAASNIFGAGR